MDPAKVEGVKAWPTLKMPTEVCTFLSFMGYYRYFIQDYSMIARPLLDLTKKATTWHWGEKQEEAFRSLQYEMCRSLVLHQPDFTKQFFLQTDALAFGLGAVLSQEHEGGRNKPKLHPITYYLATFTPMECNYDIYECELLVIMKALNNWRPYLGWMKHPFVILTDHVNLQYWKALQNLTRRTARWHADLQEYDYILRYIPGKTNIPSDFLSRPPVDDKGKNDNQQVTMLPAEQIQTTKLVEVPPILEVRRGLMNLYHDHPLSGHPGQDETLRQLQQ